MKWLLIIQLFLGRDLTEADHRFLTIEFDSPELCEIGRDQVYRDYGATVGSTMYTGADGSLRDAEQLFPIAASCIQVSGEFAKVETE